MCPLASAPRSNPASAGAGCTCSPRKNKVAWKAIGRQGPQVLRTLDISFGMNTYRPPSRVLKTNAFNYRIFHTYGKMHSKPCTMNTYKKTGGWGEVRRGSASATSIFPSLSTLSRINTAVTLPLDRMPLLGLAQPDHPSGSAGAGCTRSLRGTKGSPRQEKAFST